MNVFCLIVYFQFLYFYFYFSCAQENNLLFFCFHESYFTTDIPLVWDISFQVWKLNMITQIERDTISIQHGFGRPGNLCYELFAFWRSAALECSHSTLKEKKKTKKPPVLLALNLVAWAFKILAEKKTYSLFFHVFLTWTCSLSSLNSLYSPSPVSFIFLRKPLFCYLKIVFHQMNHQNNCSNLH